MYSSPFLHWKRLKNVSLKGRQIFSLSGASPRLVPAPSISGIRVSVTQDKIHATHTRARGDAGTCSFKQSKLRIRTKKMMYFSWTEPTNFMCLMLLYFNHFLMPRWSNCTGIMKTLGGAQSLTNNLDTRWVVNFMPRLLHRRENSPLHPLDREVGEPQGALDIVEKKYLALIGNWKIISWPWKCVAFLTPMKTPFCYLLFQHMNTFQPMVTLCTTRFRTKNIYLLPKYTAIISLYNIKRLVFITKKCVYCAVQVERLDGHKLTVSPQRVDIYSITNPYIS